MESVIGLQSKIVEAQEDLGTALKAYRVRKGLTLEGLRAILTVHGVRVSVAMLGRIERGNLKGSLPMRRRLFDFLSLEGKG